jgi:bacterioferritin-associated ferredoxin
MYLCSCNALNDAQIGDAVREGARRPREVYAALGCRAQCGRCTGTVLRMIRQGAPATPADRSCQER